MCLINHSQWRSEYRILPNRQMKRVFVWRFRCSRFWLPESPDSDCLKLLQFRLPQIVLILIDPNPIAPTLASLNQIAPNYPDSDCHVSIAPNCLDSDAYNCLESDCPDSQCPDSDCPKLPWVLSPGITLFSIGPNPTAPNSIVPIRKALISIALDLTAPISFAPIPKVHYRGVLVLRNSIPLILLNNVNYC